MLLWNRRTVWLVLSAWGVVLAAQVASGAEPFTPREVPRLQVLPLPHDQASFQRDGLELTRFHFGADVRRPYLYPIIGASGRSLTRMGHPHDPVGHSHHNSVWISHFDVNGIDFWGDRGKQAGRIIHERMEKYDDGNHATAQAIHAWRGPDGEPILSERRRVAVESLARDDWQIIIDLELSAPRQAVTLGKTPFGLLGVRMAKSIGVHDGGGRIRNSAGGVNEAEVFWKPAKWCDYSGVIVGANVEGVTLFDHPGNPNHPTVFHVRDDGWMGASFTFDAPRTIMPGEPLRLRYGLFVHRGLLEPAEIEARWSSFAGEPIPATLELPKRR